MKKKLPKANFEKLPSCAMDFIKSIVKKMRYRKQVCAEVQAELATDFEAELEECKLDDERIQVAQKLITEFGDIKFLATLLRRAKKRCRPLWQKCLIQTSKVIGIVVLYVIVRVIFLSTGTPHINIDYVDWLNKHVTTQEVETENAKIDYDRAIELSTKAPPEIVGKIAACRSTGGCDINNWIHDFNDLETELLVKWLDDNQRSFGALRQGSQKAYYWPIYKNSKSIPKPGNFLYLDAAMPLSKYRWIASCMGWQIIYDANRGKLRDALNNCLVLQRSGMHLQRKGLLNEQLVGIAIEALAHQKTFMLLENQDMPVGVLRDFYNRLQNSPINDKRPVIDVEAEKVFWYDLIQRGFTDDGKGNGRVLKNGLPLVIKDAPSSLAGFFFCNYPDRRRATATIDEYFKKTAYLMNKTPHELHVNSKSHLWDELGSECFMLKLLGPAHPRISTLNWRLKTGRSGLLTVIAIILYQKERAHYPTNLGELISNGYLKNLPLDPYSDKPLIYKKADDGFVLYSVGENFKDDSGQIVRYTDGKRKGKIKKGAEEGDWVFWPVLDK